MLLTAYTKFDLHDEHSNSEDAEFHTKTDVLSAHAQSPSQTYTRALFTYYHIQSCGRHVRHILTDTQTHTVY